MRKVNAILTVLIMILFLGHAIIGSLQLFGANNVMVMKVTSRFCAVLIFIHAAIGIRLTIDSIRVWRKTGAPYFRENALFWARRISGAAIMVLIFFHMFAFSSTVNGNLQLKPFTTAKTIMQILFVVSIALHVLTNIRPLFIAIGARSLKRFLPDILVILSIVLIISIAAFIIYYFRWQRI